MRDEKTAGSTDYKSKYRIFDIVDYECARAKQKGINY